MSGKQPLRKQENYNHIFQKVIFYLKLMLFKVKMTGLGYLLAYDDLNEKKGNWMYVLTACHQNTGIAILKNQLNYLHIEKLQ